MEVVNNPKYPFAYESAKIIPKLTQNLFTYDSTSCQIIYKILSVGMITCDLLLHDIDLTVPDRLLLNSLWESFWNGHIAFFRIGNITNGSDILIISPESRDLLNKFYDWDPVMQENPFSNIGETFLSILSGVVV